MNNYSFSKFFQDENTIKKMYERAFDLPSDNLEILLLDGGMKCAVYLLSNNDKKVVLKIAPNNQELTLSFERNTMWWEVHMLKLMEKYNVPAPKLLYYDASNELCKSSYFFMSYIEGKKLSDYKGLIDDKERSLIEYEIGKICSEISNIESDNFFIPSYKNKKITSNYEFIKVLFISLISDASSKDITIPNYSYDDFIRMLDKYEFELNTISRICLVHSDMWDGNIIIKDGHVNGIVDFADLFFCDELFNFYFHGLKKDISCAFLDGFSKNEISYDENIRISIYRIFVILKMIIEKDYKHFSDNSNEFSWLYDKLDDEMNRINNIYKK